MHKNFDLNRLNVKAFAREEISLEGLQDLPQFTRLVELEAKLGTVSHADLPGSTQISWAIQGELVPVSGGGEQIWLHLKAELHLTMQCQRCMGAVTVLVSSDQSFRFVADEATAEAEDEASEEDLLVLTPELNVWELIEDELIMCTPLVPKHDVCPTLVPMSAVDEAFEEAQDARPNPFAALAQLKKKPN
ncbi:MAG: YceD family protein [Burkholderiales bacterium]|nr:YceD family protein [Burkholderiales bacterium]